MFVVLLIKPCFKIHSHILNRAPCWKSDEMLLYKQNILDRWDAQLTCMLNICSLIINVTIEL